MPVNRSGFLLYTSRRGVAGEKKVVSLLERYENHGFHIWNNILVVDRQKRTAQIDHLMLSKSGVILIETKNFGGKIYGTEEDVYWEVVNGNFVRRFYNPLRQNHSHAVVLQDILQEDIPIHSIVCFSDRADLRIRVQPGKVIRYKGLPKFIEKHSAYKILSKDILENLILRINSSIRYSKYFKNRHKKRIVKMRKSSDVFLQL